MHLNGFEVAQTKDGIRWDENEQPFLELLLEHLDSDDLPLIRQANGYRVRTSRAAVQKAARQAVDRTVTTLERTLEPVLNVIAEKVAISTPPPKELPQLESLAERELNIRFRGIAWRIIIELNDDPSVGEWLAISDTSRPTSSGKSRQLRLRLSLAHPFMVRFSGADSSAVEPLLRSAAAMGLAEVLARRFGYKSSGHDSAECERSSARFSITTMMQGDMNTAVPNISGLSSGARWARMSARRPESCYVPRRLHRIAMPRSSRRRDRSCRNAFHHLRLPVRRLAL